MQITFHGAAQEVTGSCYLVEATGVRFLVDCGMFQGGPDARERNARPFSFDPATIDFVLLTHAHIDHSGRIPSLALRGYRGPIYATEGTIDLLSVMLPDSGHIQETEANRNLGRSRGDRQYQATALYTLAEAQASLKLLKSLGYDAVYSPHPAVQCCYRDAGHILGSASIEVWISEGDTRTKIVFSGDLGQPDRPIIRDPTPIAEADYLIVESTYGDRSHKTLPRTLDELVEAITETFQRKHGNVIVPAFAVGRTQEIIYYLHQLTRDGRLQDLSIFVDSPMASRATAITMRHVELFDGDARTLEQWRIRGRGVPKLRFVETVDESRSLNRIRSGAIIIAASGMCDAGRIRHHLRHCLPRRECTILIAGFQAQGTLGRRLVDGAKEVTLFGESVPVAAEIRTLGGLSAHADQPALLGWLGHFRRPPRNTFVVHGEARQARALAEAVTRQRNWRAHVPRLGETIVLASAPES